MPFDPLDPILDGLKLRSSIFARMELRGRWGFQKPSLEGSPFYIVGSGQFDICLQNGMSVTATSGDVVILPRGDAHVFRSGPFAQLVPFKQVLAGLGWEVWTPGMRYKTGVLRHECGDGPLASIIAGVFDFEHFGRNPLLLGLPDLLHIRRDAPTLRAAVELSAVVPLLIAEVCNRLPGSSTIAGRLADVLFVHAVRTYLRAEPIRENGWGRGLQDARIAKALAAIHDDPGRAWTVESLAVAAGMSRARFASYFRELVGQSPITYLTTWRMHCAARELKAGRKTLASISAENGYRSEIAFSKAFKKQSGLHPREYRRSSPDWPDNQGEDLNTSTGIAAIR